MGIVAGRETYVQFELEASSEYTALLVKQMVD